MESGLWLGIPTCIEVVGKRWGSGANSVPTGSPHQYTPL